MATRTEKIAELLKAGDDPAAEKLLLTEIRYRESRLQACREFHPPYLAYEQLAKIYRKRKEYEREVQIVKRCFHAKRHLGLPSGRLGERLRRAVELQCKVNGCDVPVDCSQHRFAAFDLCTSKVLPPDSSNPINHRPLGISCASVVESLDEPASIWHSDDTGKPSSKMTRTDLCELVEYLENLIRKGVQIITWNGLGFDFDILSEETGMNERCRSLALQHIDLMFLGYCYSGFPVAFNSAVQAMFPANDGLELRSSDVAASWEHGQYEQIIEFARKKCSLLLQLAYECDRRECLQWVTKKNKIGSISLDDGLLSVQQSLSLPEPDTSWMQNPMPRSRYLDWLSLPDPSIGKSQCKDAVSIPSSTSHECENRDPESTK